MDYILITDKKTSKRLLTPVQTAVLIMHGIDYTENNGVMVFTVDYNDGYLYDIKDYINRVLA